MGLRDLYNQLEKLATPVLTEAIRTPQFAQAAAAFTALDKTLRNRVGGLQARVWHAVNLPAGSDVTRLRQQLGSLDRELRLLSLELQQQRREAKRRGDSRPEHD